MMKKVKASPVAQLLLFITVRLKELLVILPPLDQGRAQLWVDLGETGEYRRPPHLHLQVLWRRHDHRLV